MLASANCCTNLTIFIMLYYFLLLTSSYFLVFCQENASYQDLRLIASNLTVPYDGMTRSDRTLNNQDIESKFFIKANVIIRTGESRALGAIYINETRLPTNHDCLTWCLETPSCNTAVHEEKNMQSCYMFDCGSPAKPLCKFTPHNFFTSSVLKMTQHSYELSQWGRQVQQERGNVEQKIEVTTTTPAPLDKHTVATSSVHPASNEHSEKKGSACHHYQFQCVNSSECIAIYNVCDGIPQCPDGSDESLELNCPNKDTLKENTNNKDQVDAPPAVGKITPPQKLQPTSVKPSVPQTGLQDKTIPSYKKPPEPKEVQHKNFKGVWQNPYSGSPISKNGYHHHHVDNSDGLSSPFIKHSQFISANDPHAHSLNQWASDYDQYPPHSTSLEQQYNPYDRMDEQYLSNQMSPDYETAAKNFASYHQDDIPYWPNQDILQDNSYTADEFPQAGVQSLNKPINYPDKENIYAQQIARNEQYPEAKLGMHGKQLVNSNEPADIVDYKLRRYPHPKPQQPYMALEDSLQQHYSNYPHVKAKDYSDSLPNLEDYNNDDLIRASLVNQLPKKIEQIHHTHDHNLKHLDKDMLHPSPKEKNVLKSTKATKDNSLIIVKPTSHTKSIQRTVLDFKMSMAELYQSSSTHSHEANSAILALVVGVTVSFFLIILLACRMKTLRRRMSRKGRGLTHDADYLVNGMYL